MSSLKLVYHMFCTYGKVILVITEYPLLNKLMLSESGVGWDLRKAAP